MHPELRDRKKGCFYGLAIGDALGAAVEFRDRGTFAPVTGYRGLGPHGLDPGEWTDDTSMALALADSIAQKGWDLKDQLERYVEWYQNGKYSVNNWCFDIGGTTRSALDDFMQTGQVVANHDTWSAGNGSIMRLAPVSICCDDLWDNWQRASESSKTTHSHRLCVSACSLLHIILWTLMRCPLHVDTREVEIGRIFEEYKFESPIATICCNIKGEGANVQGSGFVVQSLEAALWSFLTSNSFEEAVLKAVNLGDDADTTGAVAGQLAGAYWGFSGIPQHLVDGLAKREMIDLYLDPLLEL
jgi:ADP-ribosyl-[dinitrogen reductase] hydrolase